jgi:hypothetical protein
MAAGKSTNEFYYGISNGKIVRQFMSKTDNSIERINKNGRIVYEEFYDFIDGTIMDISVKVHDEYGKFWVVVLKDDNNGTIQHLQFNYSSGYANGFLKALPNVDLSQKVKIIPNAKKEGDKTKTTIFISQFDKAVKWYFTKNNPNGLPELKKIKIKGKSTWDDSEAMEFLESIVVNQILPKILKPA